jgi:hypothetical protein
VEDDGYEVAHNGVVGDASDVGNSTAFLNMTSSSGDIDLTLLPSST